MNLLIDVLYIYDNILDNLSSMDEARYSIDELFSKVISRYPESNNESFETERDNQIFSACYRQVYDLIDSYVMITHLEGNALRMVTLTKYDLVVTTE